MGLITVDRLTSGDRVAWERLFRADRRLGRVGPWADREATAQRLIRDFVDAGPCYLGVSWGKDSVAVAWLTYQVAPEVPWVWVDRVGYSNPDCPLVRDAMLDLCPGVDYHEIRIESAAPLPDGSTPFLREGGRASEQNLTAGFQEASRRFGDRYLSGVRASESWTRKVGQRARGLTTARTCAPIGWWSTPQVFAFLARHDLPTHPAYACSAGGLLDRNQLRVSAVGGQRGRTMGRGEWEARYYPEMVGQHRRGRPADPINPWAEEAP